MAFGRNFCILLFVLCSFFIIFAPLCLYICIGTNAKSKIIIKNQNKISNYGKSI